MMFFWRLGWGTRALNLIIKMGPTQQNEHTHYLQKEKKAKKNPFK
jgi:hypothetical protein